ncbi:hypothetical protein [Candidatus Methylocalor cossyra]|uniref:Uncharacterized protein n=1 Tax=Candidatus Methylocalor cossyra TaxID=3108543 RepID=A0ABM9NH51_9GAMM
MSNAVWRIGPWLNAVQSTFVGLLRVGSIPIVLLLSTASGYTTYYGLSHFINGWIALIVTVAVQGIIVICTLELAGLHWRANPLRFAMVVLSLGVALIVSVSFSYFKFYEFSQRDSLLIERQRALDRALSHYLDQLVAAESRIVAAQRQRIEQAARDTTQAYLGVLPGMGSGLRHPIGRGPVWSHYNEILQGERAKLKQLEAEFQTLESQVTEVRARQQEFAFQMKDGAAYQRLAQAFRSLQGGAETVLSAHGVAPLEAPRFGSYAEFAQGLAPSFAMWKNISWFALACAAMVDFFTLVLSYRLELSAPGPLTEEEKDLVYQGICQFGEFTINKNDELEFVIERTELERARRFQDWNRMFTVAFLLNRGYLRKISDRAVEFAPNLYPIVAERMIARRGEAARGEPAGTEELAEALRRKSGGRG